MNAPMELDERDLALVKATQGGLPLVAEPYRAVGECLGLSAQEVIARLRHLLDAGVIRRIGAVPNHYALGYVANGMTVWDLADDKVDDLGERIGALAFVSHCYRRPRHLPEWPYNLFAMVHARDRDTVSARVAEMVALLGTDYRSHDVLYSSRILKKTGVRLSD